LKNPTNYENETEAQNQKNSIKYEQIFGGLLSNSSSSNNDNIPMFKSIIPQTNASTNSDDSKIGDPIQIEINSTNVMNVNVENEIVQFCSLSGLNILFPLNIQILEQMFDHTLNNKFLTINNDDQVFYFSELLPILDSVEYNKKHDKKSKLSRMKFLNSSSFSTSANAKKKTTTDNNDNNEKLDELPLDYNQNKHYLIRSAFQIHEFQLYIFDCVYNSVEQLLYKCEMLRLDGNRLNLTQLSLYCCWNIYFNMFVGKQISLNFVELYPNQHVIQQTFTDIVSNMQQRKYSSFWRLFRSVF
jgi:hypothetical protein